MEYNKLDIGLPKQLDKMNKDELQEVFENTTQVDSCITELADIYQEIATDRCFRTPFRRGQVVELILEDVTIKGLVVGYEFGMNQNREPSDLIMIAFFKDEEMTDFKELKAFKLVEVIKSFNGVPIAPDTQVLNFGGALEKKVKEI